MSAYAPVDGSPSTARENEAKKYMVEADHKLNEKSSWFKSMMGLADGNKYEDAAQLFIKAGNTYKLGKSWKKAGEAFVRAAECYAQTSSGKYDAAVKYSDAAKAFKNGYPAEAISASESSIELYENLGRFQQCARLMKDLAEIHEANGETEKAIAAYSRAADFYDGEDAKANANTCRIKVAELSALARQYQVAIELYESVAQAALDSNLLKYGAKEHLLRAGMCRLCLGDDVGANRAVERYMEMDPSFEGSRECKLLQAIISAVEEGDVEAFTNAAYDFHSIAALDSWKTTILLSIKKTLKSEEEDLT